MLADEKLDALLNEWDEIAKEDAENAPLILSKRYKGTSEYEDVSETLCNSLLDVIQRSTDRYSEDFPKNTVEVSLFFKLTDEIQTNENEELCFYLSVAAFFKGEYRQALKLLKTSLPKIVETHRQTKPFDTVNFAAYIATPFKNAFPGFWEEMEALFKTLTVQPEVRALCRAMAKYYAVSSMDEQQGILEDALAEQPGCEFLSEMLAKIYCEKQMWGNAAALFERIENPQTMFPQNVSFCRGWCYGKIKEFEHQIEAYEHCVEIAPDFPYALNNLGYAYYRAKQYRKAKETFERCFELKIDLTYATNNYVRTLLAMKRFKDAKLFVKNPPAKVSKSFLEKVAKAENTNSPLTADPPIPKKIAVSTDDDGIEEREPAPNVRKQQFTSERILEEELLLRMESGAEVFGKHLKIYRRKGIYGRQYILSNGKRIDLLAEDEQGNLYVIELKKDSGYDDVYEQTADYLDWFEQNWAEKKTAIYGIICLNDPSRELLARVHANKRIRLYEYRISYTER